MARSGSFFFAIGAALLASIGACVPPEFTVAAGGGGAANGGADATGGGGSSAGGGDTTTTTTSTTTSTTTTPEPPANDACPGENMEIAMGQVLIVPGTTVGAASDVAPSACAKTEGPDVVYQVKAAADGWLSVSFQPAPSGGGEVQIQTQCNMPLDSDVCGSTYAGTSVLAGSPVTVVVRSASPEVFSLRIALTDSHCGNGFIDAIKGETCDDGNFENGDGCEGCQVFCGCPSCGQAVTDFKEDATNRCYVLVSQPDFTWDAGRAVCQSWGGDYAVPRSDSNYVFLATHAGMFQGHTWFGAMESSGALAWIDGSAASDFVLWAAGEPSFDGVDLTCAFLFGQSGFGTSGDEKCNEPNNILCERAPAGILP